MEQALHRLLCDIDRNDLPAVRAHVEVLDDDARRALFAPHQDTVEPLQCALQQLPEAGPGMVLFLLRAGAAPQFRHANAFCHLIYREMASAPDEPSADTYMQILRGSWALGVGRVAPDEVSDGWTPVHIAAAQSDATLGLDHLRQLHAHGYGLDVRDEVGETPLLVAAWKSRVPVLEYLLGQGARLDARTRGGRDIVAYALRRSLTPDRGGLDAMVEILKFLHDRGYPVEASMGQHQLPDPRSQAQLEAAVLRHAPALPGCKRTGPRL